MTGYITMFALAHETGRHNKRTTDYVNYRLWCRYQDDTRGLHHTARQWCVDQDDIRGLHHTVHLWCRNQDDTRE